jgi:hypothetical protein
LESGVRPAQTQSALFAWNKLSRGQWEEKNGDVPNLVENGQEAVSDGTGQL